MTLSKKHITFAFFILFTFACFGNGRKENSTEQPVEFMETWGFVSMERADEYDDTFPLTDVCFFSGDFNCYGELVGIPKRSTLEIEGKRTHIVFICDSRSLTHFVISPEYSVRENAIKEMVKAAEDFDGLQIDFELIPARDKEYFHSFLKDLRKALGSEKIFSICVPARTKAIKDDIFAYPEIAALCDRVIVMAYDEHWSTSAPGPIASVSWCKNIVNYAYKTIPKEKLIMGIPFYARTWADKSTSGAWYFSRASRIMNENNVQNFTYKDGIPTFSYTTEVTVTGFMNDVHSFLTLANLYKNAGVSKTAFWRVGQEDPEIWNNIIIDPLPKTFW